MSYSPYCISVRDTQSFHRRLILEQLKAAFPFVSMIIVEPILSPLGPHYMQPLRNRLVTGAYERRDVWKTREIARKNLMQNKTKTWDPRIVDLFVVR